MKKIFTTMLVAMALMMAVPTQAQIKFGLKGGLNVTNMSFSSDVIDQSNKEGFFFGPTVKFSVPIVGLGVDLAALYDQRDAKMDNKTISQRSINVPVNLRYGVGLGSLASIYFAAGPQFGFNIGDKRFNVDEQSNNFKLKDSNLSLNLGAGVRLINHIEIGFSYNIALGNTGEFDGIGDAVSGATNAITGKGKSNAWQISAAYYF